MIDGVITSQSGARQFDGTDITKYSLFVGGVNATNHALRQYSPLVNGFCRLFMVRPPFALMHIMAGGNPANYYSTDSLFMQFKHILEYMNRSVTGIQPKTLEQTSTPLQGGFAGRQFNVPTITKESTNEITIGVYEFAGCPLATILDSWMNMIGDENSGLATYGGHISGGRDAAKREVPLNKYNGTKDQKYWKELIRLLPEGWLQTRTVTMNYEVLRNIYSQRRNHRLTEWHQFCNWVKELPYAKELIIYNID